MRAIVDPNFLKKVIFLSLPYKDPSAAFSKPMSTITKAICALIDYIFKIV